MNITTGGTTYKVERYTYGWTLEEPTRGVNPKTRELADSTRHTYHATLGQCLAAIADKEQGKATTVEELVKMCKRLRRDLLAVTHPSHGN